MRLLVINADDLGLAPGVNRGILQAHTAGTVTSASLLATGSAFDDAIELLRTDGSRLSVGLHLDLVSGRPIAHVPSLTDPATGSFYPLRRLVWRALRRLVRAEEVARECDAQLARLRAAGLRPTHVDSHCHTHVLPGVLPAVVDAARRANVHLLRRPIGRLRAGTIGASAKGMALRAAWAIAARDLTLPPAVDHFRGLELYGRVDFGARLLDLLDALPAGTTELLVHPGFLDDTLTAIDPYTAEREREVHALTSEAVRARLHRGDIRLIPMSEVRCATAMQPGRGRGT
jgi:predicted glycoside hydrolase/deacetylase ChbG (UPF0249 family)